MINKKIGFIGIGNMGYSILKGIVNSKKVDPQNISVRAKSEKTLSKAENKLKVKASISNKDLAKSSDIIFIGVKPNIHRQVLNEIKKSIKENTIIITMAAGVLMNDLREVLGEKVKIVKIMPNTPALVQMSMTAMSSLNLNSKEEKEIKLLLETFGLCRNIPEDLMDTFTGISGSSPAYAFIFIEAMAESAVKHGMERNLAYEFSAQALKGAAEMVLKTGIHPGELKDMVTSPKGATIEAVISLEENGFRNSIIKAVDTAIEKSKEMTEK